jgi:S1-C subfamily serine protease
MVLTIPDPDQMAMLGVSPPEDERFRGLLVLAVAPASAAAVAGLTTGDILLAVSGTAVDDPTQLSSILEGRRSATIQFWRDGGMSNAAVGGLERRGP